MGYEKESRARDRLPLIFVALVFFLFQIYLSYQSITDGFSNVALTVFGPYFGLVLLVAAVTGTVRTGSFKLVSTAGVTVALAVGFLMQPSFLYVLLGGFSLVATAYYVWKLVTR